MMQTLFSHIIFSLHIIQLQTFFAPPLSEYTPPRSQIPNQQRILALLERFLINFSNSESGPEPGDLRATSLPNRQAQPVKHLLALIVINVGLYSYYNRSPKPPVSLPIFL